MAAPIIAALVLGWPRFKAEPEFATNVMRFVAGYALAASIAFSVLRRPWMPDRAQSLCIGAIALTMLCMEMLPLQSPVRRALNVLSLVGYAALGHVSLRKERLARSGG
ncbi:MAG: hypothetical protein NW201_10765 [Gemmatimonadales bacterium]|nr:hypothetical protein [Gemmatimonadales bacterium]